MLKKLGLGGNGMEKLRVAVNWLYGLWVKSLSDKEVQDNYVAAGAEFGDAVSYGCLGELMGSEAMFLDWAKWELEYSRRGYRTLSLDALIDYGGYGKSLKGLGAKREPDEKIILHADIYGKKYSRRIKPVINFKKIIDTCKSQSGKYNLPSTKDEQ